MWYTFEPHPSVVQTCNSVNNEVKIKEDIAACGQSVILIIFEDAYLIIKRKKMTKE